MRLESRDWLRCDDLTRPVTHIRGRNARVIVHVSGRRSHWFCYTFTMNSASAARTSVVLLLAWVMAAACTVSPNPSQCRLDTDVLCPGDFVGYSCQGGSKPSASCGNGTLESDGETGYCCAVESAATCVVDPSTACTDESTGYVCTGPATPDETQAALVCSSATPGPDRKSLFCCTTS